MDSFHIKISEEQIKRAEALYEFHNLKNSITNGESQLYGAIGEILVMDFISSYGLECDYAGDYDYDLICNTLKIDVKSCRVNVTPKGGFNANISALNTKQQTDVYFWVFIHVDKRQAWLVGWMGKEAYFQDAIFHPKGQDDGGGWEFKSDTYSMVLDELLPPLYLITFLQSLKQSNMSKTKQVYENVREDLGLEFQPQQINQNASLYQALSNFQQEVPVIHKATQGYGYTYADLTKIIQVINPLLAKHGLGYSQPLMGTTINTIVFHIESGQSIQSSIEIPQGVSLKGMNDFQVLGSAISYLRRYSLASILTLVTDADLDASGEQVKKTKKVEQAKPKLSETDFLRLCGAINGKKEHNGKLMDKAWAMSMYDLTEEQINTISMINTEQ